MKFKFKTRFFILFLLPGILLFSYCKKELDQKAPNTLAHAADDQTLALVDTAAMRKALSLINLDHAGLENVKNKLDSPLVAMEALLQYYRTRTSVKHPSMTLPIKVPSGGTPPAKNVQLADSALLHYMMGQPAYGLKYVGKDINWIKAPDGITDREWVWQLNRMPSWNAMADVYRYTGDEKYAKEWALQLLDWIKKSPNDAEHIVQWRTIDIGERCSNWQEQFFKFASSPSVSATVLAKFLVSLHDQINFLTRVYAKSGNWVLIESQSMLMAGVLFREFKDAENWRITAVNRYNTQLTKQVNSDGHQNELSLSYHLGCVDIFTKVYELTKANGMENSMSTSFISILKKMAQVPMHLAYPDGSMPQFGDSWYHGKGYLYNWLKKYSTQYGLPELLYVATQGKEGSAPAETAFSYPVSGFYSVRNGWDLDATVMVLKCGKDGGWHCQPDNGTFELYAGQRNLMQDAGAYKYSGSTADNADRAWFRQTSVHQTLTLNGANSKYAPNLVKWQPGSEHDLFSVQNQSYSGLAHRRTVFFVDKKYFVIVDDATGTATGDVAVHFQLGPKELGIFDNQKLSAQSNYPDGWNVLVRTAPQAGLSLIQEKGEISLEYTKKEPRPAFRYQLRKTSATPVRFVTLVAPYAGQTPPNISFEEVPSSTGIRIKVTDNGAVKEIECPLL